MQNGRAPLPPLAGMCDNHLRDAITKALEISNIDDNQLLLVNIWRKIETSDKKQLLRSWIDRAWVRFISALEDIPVCNQCACHDREERLGLLSTEGADRLRDFIIVFIRCSMNATETPAAWSVPNVTWWRRSGSKLQSLSRLKWLGKYTQSVVQKGRSAGKAECSAHPPSATIIVTLSIETIIDAGRDYEVYAVPVYAVPQQNTQPR
jgi:hypothetical protein